MKFGKTTKGEFESLVKGATAENAGNRVTTYTLDSPDISIYKRVRVGFNDGKLDWIEYAFNPGIRMSDIARLYGKPGNINAAYSNKLDYYDYGFFNVSTDKKHALARFINFFSEGKPATQSRISLAGIPAWQNLCKVNFLGLKPGYTLEIDFRDKYPLLLASKQDKGESTIYNIDGALTKSCYSKGTLVFKNGLLRWVSLTPRDMPVAKVVKTYGKKYKLQHLNSKTDLYDYSSIILAIDKVHKKVTNIGIIGPKE